ncbi:MAG: DUF1385 domain-containing protein [Deltaproteobacteria bacterium]|nr:DUF1385 domain-containing protein [Deltaproteobacteria bacterium]
MMRSPHSFAVAVRTPDGGIVVRESPWDSIWERLKFLKWPLLRGSVVLLETLWNGISALNFSAEQSIPREEGADKDEPPISKAAIAGTIAVALVFGLALFVALPHFLTWLLGRAAGSDLDVKSFAFHLIDGVIKMAIFVLYIWLISFINDIRRTFMYHGAEHKSIFAYENHEALTVENARGHSPEHPRCGTAFLLIVLLISIFTFAAIFPFVPPLVENAWLNNLTYVFIKIALVFPIGGISYELLKLSGKHRSNALVRALSSPGLLMQRLTTREPTDDQIEVALVSLRKTLWREARWGETPRTSRIVNVEKFSGFPDYLTKYPDDPSQ